MCVCYCCCLFNLRVPLLPVLLELSWVCLWVLWGWRSLHLATTKTTILCFMFLLFWCEHFSNSQNAVERLNFLLNADKIERNFPDSAEHITRLNLKMSFSNAFQMLFGQKISLVCYLFFPLHPSVLIPCLHLHLSESTLFCQFVPLVCCEVLCVGKTKHNTIS